MKPLKKAILLLVMITLPLLIIITSIRLILTPLFLEVEYRLPGFPQDLYGFNLEDRLHWSDISRQYLLNFRDIDFLGSRNLDNGQSLFNERELGHMEDVKILTRSVLIVWYFLIILTVIIFLWVWKNGGLIEFWDSVSSGGWIALGLVGTITIGVMLNFNALFTFFHQIFFEGDSWLFSYSDSLIRLFPLRFWQDVFIAIGGLSIIISSVAINIGRKFSHSNLLKKK